MIFSDEALKELQDEYQTVFCKYQELMNSYLVRNYLNARAQEFARHGFSRRLKTLARCIDRIFEILPPDRIELPTNDELSDAAINIQAFVINVFGCMDNLAWIWVLERDLRRDDGSPIPNSWVGLRQNNDFVCGSLSPEYQTYLEGLNQWNGNLENFRHALAHRIPLYIPPYVVPEAKTEDYLGFEELMTEALRQGDLAEHSRLSDEQNALCEFRPYMTHSFEEEANFVVFHAQLLADFNTIYELGQKMLEELDR